MSDEEEVVTETQVLTAEFKDGQLEIVEVTPFDNNEGSSVDSQILPDMSAEEGEDQEPKFQILDSSKGLMQLDLLNLTLVKCGDGEESYRLVTNQEAGELGETVTCVLQASDGEGDGDDGENSYIDKKQVYLTGENQDQYVMVNGEDGPIVILKSALEDTGPKQKKKQTKKLTAVELLEKAKALQKAKAALRPAAARRGRKRGGALPPPHELLASPNFKLFLYSCKLCSFKCNAIKDLTHHKTTEHSEGGGRARGGARASSTTLQCARCPFRGGTHSQLMKHVQELHLTDSGSTEVYLNSAEAEAADVLVCGACGFESASRPVFRKHIEEKHHANTS